MDYAGIKLNFKVKYPSSRKLAYLSITDSRILIQVSSNESNNLYLPFYFADRVCTASKYKYF